MWEQGYTGAGVHISITDDALELAHPDLRANILPDASRNYLARSDLASESLRKNPLPVDCEKDAHGTAVAGIIAGVGDNNIGIKGVAPRAKIYFANVLKAQRQKDIQDALTNHTTETAVSSNSWGPSEYTRLRPQDALEKEAMLEQLDLGYGGKGISYVLRLATKGL